MKSRVWTVIVAPLMLIPAVAQAESRTAAAVYIASVAVGVWPANDIPLGVGGVRFSVAPDETSMDLAIADVAVPSVAGIYYLADVANSRALGGGVFCGSIQDVAIHPDADTLLVRPVVHALEMPSALHGFTDCMALASAGTVTVRFTTS